MKLNDDLRAEYQQLWNRATILDRHQFTVGLRALTALKYQARYVDVVRGTPIPWYVVACIHSLEADFDFTCHLHNGDSLLHRTVHVPAGHPLTGEPPFLWEFSARDALQLEGFEDILEWNLVSILYHLEAYNGWGYRQHHPAVLTPYLWSFTNLYRSGKYTADGEFSPSAVSQQTGAVALLKKLVAMEAIRL